MRYKLVNGVKVPFTSAEELERDAEEAQAAIEQTKASWRTVLSRIKNHAVKLSGEKIPAIDSYAMLDFLRELWPMLNTASASNDMKAVKDVVLYARSKYAELKRGTLQDALAYVPADDLNWPG